MTRVFADTQYWIAVVDPKDDLHERARQASGGLGGIRVVTSETVLVEFLDAFADKGEQLRRAAIRTIEQLRRQPDVEIVPQTSHLFREAFDLYRDRQDQEWSVTDCSSFVIMREREIREALTHDHHFEQAGFTALLR